jgi:hypothetical protein
VLDPKIGGNVEPAGEIMRRVTALATVLWLCVPAFAADQTMEQKRLETCGQVLREILDTPDDILKDLLDKAECLIVFPKVLKVAIGVGGDFWPGRDHLSHWRTLHRAVERPSLVRA